MLGKSFQQYSNISDNVNLFDLYAFSELNTTIPSIKASHESFRKSNNYRYKRVILLVRDPRDAVISKYFGQTRKVKKDQNLTLSEYIFEKNRLDYYIYFYNSWIQNKHIPQKFLLIRYENLLENTYEELRKIIDFLNLHIDKTTLKNSIQYASFENMRKMEKNPKYQTGVFKPGDINDTESYKTRKGKSGTFKDYLNSEQVTLMEDILARQLSPCLGYNYFSSKF